ncbi:uncharacterized protein EI97DRAFT_463880 [Westerdykella ornata]|uniref:DUF7626 domain-containing protein n=1 Tax=Westerdykella ornata TaxID=318751 RepID=A0A6A6K0D8_WESOR|nr:uncharacterized protein EI97DRAFT_463880 [Westerdykella ornata]KAF2281578.1 hypothetical protein EI97DRAFT_463880 [Westerdykella ornata]
MPSIHTFTIKEKGGSEINYDDDHEMPDYSGLPTYRDADEGDEDTDMGLFGYRGLRQRQQAARRQVIEEEAEMEEHEEDYEGAGEEDEEDEDDNDSTFRLEGYEDLDDANAVPSGAEPSDSDYAANDESDSDNDENNSKTKNSNRSRDSTMPPPAKKTRPAHFSRSITAARRAALRTEVNAAHSFLLHESPSGSAFATPTRRGRTSLTATRGAGGGGEAGSVRSATPMGLTYNKKITAELDSDDDLIMNMRSAGYTDAQIATRLTREGRHTFNAKSISTRIGRIKYAQYAQSDYLLKEGYKEWTHEDDLRLMQAYEFAEMEIRYEIEKARAWRWRKVSEFLRRMDAECIFSEKACRERFIALEEGTAKIPIDEDDDPEARRKEMEEYREGRERARLEEENKKRQEEDLKKRIKEEAKLRSSEKAEALAKKREARQKEKAQKARQKAAKTQMWLARVEENAEQKERRAEELRQKKREEKIKEELALLSRNKNAHVPLTFVADLKNVTAETPDPRIFLDLKDLKHLCKERNLNDEGSSKEELVKSLRDADDLRPLAELKKMCRMRGLNTAGTKMQQKYQLALAEAKKYPSFLKNTSRDQVEDDADEE